MQSGILGLLWHHDAVRDAARLEATFRTCVLSGDRAARDTRHVGQSALTCLTTPSNKPASEAPTPLRVYAGGGLLVAADAWLVNAPQLSADLGLHAATGAAELIARLYQSDGEAGLDRLDGDFAFVLLDMTTDTVIARRDPFGVRPLFWALVPGGGLAFCSLPEVIPNAGLIAGARDVDGVLDQLAHSSAERPRTMIKGLNRVPPCTQMTLRRGQADPTYRTYWKPQPVTADMPAGFDAWTDRLRILMDGAVSARLPRTGDLAASISSGLDSTSVAMLAARNLTSDQHIFASTYAASVEAEAKYPGMLDETEVASQVVANSNRISWEKMRYIDKPVAVDVPLGAAAWDLDPTATPEFHTAVRAAELGADVILTGWGGDNVVTYKGHGLSGALLKSGKWTALRDLHDHRKRAGERSWKFYARAAFDSVFSEGSAVREALKGPFRDTYNFNHKLMTGLQQKRREKSPMQEYRSSNTQANRLAAITSPVLAFRLEALACHGLRSGVRYVHPMLDRTLINFALTCPPEYEFRDGLLRAPVRAAMAGILPDVARLNAQTGYPLVEASLSIAEAKDVFLAKLAEFERDPRLQDWFDFDFIRTHLERLPSVEVARQHVIDVSTSGKKQPSPINLSVAAVSSMAALQKAMDEAEADAVG